MPKEIDIDALMKGLSNDGIGKNADSAFDMLKEANKILKELQKTVDFFDKAGLKPLIIRGLGKKLDIDPETPVGDHTKLIMPRTDAHKQLFEQLNAMDEKQLIEMFKEGKDA